MQKKNKYPFERIPVQISLFSLLATGLSLKYSSPKLSLVFLGIYWTGLAYDSFKENDTPLGKYVRGNF
tara:strand:- start:187 stop:390 length:204 start_codon:yes stop_codon:yes gene_type:complete